MITLAQAPGFVDLPDSALAAESFALGLHAQRALDNAKLGIVRPEFFLGTYTHGQTVALPTSPIDGYTYERDELVYLWSYGWTGGTSEAKLVSAKGSIWYFGALVDQATGEVSSFIKYRESGSQPKTMTNDGWLNVVTIGVRRKNSLTATGAAWTEVPDSAFAQDKAVTATLAAQINQSAKHAALSFEAVYMGEFIHGQQIPAPVSPVDGHTYGYSDVQYAYSWRWTTEPNAFQDPAWVNIGGVFGSIGLNQLHRIAATIDATGHVTLNVVHYDDHEQPTNHGRITVVALCRRPTTLSALAPTFVDVSEDLEASGAPARYDVLRSISQVVKAAAVRQEVFAGSYTNGATVPTPVSPIDGYAYARNELFYLCDFASTAPETDIRIQSFAVSVNTLTGVVQSNVNRIHDGGRFVPTGDGTVRVWTIAQRGHEAVVAGISAGTTTGAMDPEAQLVNGDFELWSSPAQLLADNWKQAAQTNGTFSFGRGGGLAGGSQASQIFQANAGSGSGITSAKLLVKPSERRAFSWAQWADVATTGGFIARVLLWNATRTVSAFFDVYSNAPAAAGTVRRFEWVQIPAFGEATALCSQGTSTLVNPGTGVGYGALDFDPAWAQLQFFNWLPNVNSSFAVDVVEFLTQADVANGQVSSRGSVGLAFFPAVPITIGSTTAAFDLSAPLERNDGSSTPTGLGTVSITGLAASTQYAVELYYDEVDKVVKAAGLGAGHGSNGWCFLPSELTRAMAVEWGNVAHLPLSEGPIYFTTTAAGSPPGSGFGGGDGGCHREDVLARRRNPAGEELTVPLRFVKPGDFLWNGGEEWTEVESNAPREHSDWIHFDFDGGPQDLPVTSGHTFEETDGRLIRAYEVGAITTLRTPTGRTSPTRIQRRQYPGRIAAIRCKAPHTFMVSTDSVTWVQSHNNNRLISTL